jgi:hypothetical protein
LRPSRVSSRGALLLLAGENTEEARYAAIGMLEEHDQMKLTAVSNGFDQLFATSSIGNHIGAIGAS